MDRSPHIKDRLGLGLAASLLLHAAALAALVTFHEQSSPRIHPEATNPFPPSPDQELSRLGVERSEHATINWIGFADPTPHKALPSEIEQAALSLAPIGEPVPSPSQAPSPDAEPRPAQSEPTQPAAAPPQSAGGQAPPMSEEPWTIEQPESPNPDFLPIPSETPSETREAESEQNPEPTPELNPTSTDTPEPAPPIPDGGPAGADDQPGLPSDRESSPTALEMAMSLNDWGKPAAGEGIEVIPQRPRWGPTVVSLAWPRNPTVIIEFGRDGHARAVRFAQQGDRVLDTGSSEVDRVLINTLYNWRARGEKIDALTEEGPGSRFTIRMHIRLRW